MFSYKLKLRNIPEDRRTQLHHGKTSNFKCAGTFNDCYFLSTKEKCTLVHALRLCTGRTAHRGSRGIALLFHDHGTRRGWGVSVTPRPLFTPGKDPVAIVQEAGWAPGPVWTGAENLAPTGIRSLDRPARSQSLCRFIIRTIKSTPHILQTQVPPTPPTPPTSIPQWFCFNSLQIYI